MSKLLYKKPYIETVLEALTVEEIGDLKTIINSSFVSGTPVVVLNDSNFKCLKSRWSNKTIKQIQVKEDTIIYQGIVILTTNVKVLLRPQGVVSGPIEIWNLAIDANGVLTGYTKQADLVDVEEFRRTIDDIVEIGEVSTDIVYAKEELEIGESAELGENLEDAIQELCGNATAITTTTDGGATSIALKFCKLTQAQYDSIATKDTNTFYIIVE